VGVRWPSHPFIQAVIRECGFPLAAPSANPSNRLSPTSACHVREALGNKIRLIIDGGPSQVGIESTVLDLTTSPAQVLRPGMIHSESLLAALGNCHFTIVDRPLHREAERLAPREALRSPGQLKKHYSPKASLAVLSWRDDIDLKRQMSELKCDPARSYVIAHSCIPVAQGLGGVSIMPREAGAYARGIYAELHRCDAANAKWILVEALPEGREWQAIADRLQRAAHFSAA
jgi:L-threonylcarbamoyladenylate synthase